MEAWLDHLVTQSVAYSLMAVMLVAFLESLALVGLLLPGTVMMASLGALIGGGQLGFYSAWAAGIVGCLLGDWISYFIGRRFKTPLHNWSFLKKHHALLRRTEHALHQHPMITVIIGRFVGPTRPLIPMVAGMLELPAGRFAVPNIIGCLTWPPVYLMPGILAGVAIYIPEGANSASFRWLLLGVALMVWVAGWLSWRWWRSRKSHRASKKMAWLTAVRLRWVTPVTLVVALSGIAILLQHPMMPIYSHLLGKVMW